MRFIIYVQYNIFPSKLSYINSQYRYSRVLHCHTLTKTVSCTIPNLIKSEFSNFLVNRVSFRVDNMSNVCENLQKKTHTSLYFYRGIYKHSIYYNDYISVIRLKTVLWCIFQYIIIILPILYDIMNWIYYIRL